MPNYPQLFQRYRLLSNGLFIALLLLIVYWNLARPTKPGLNVLLLLIQLAPMLALTPGLRSRYYRAYSWLCFVTLLYFVFAVMAALASNAGLVDYLFVTLCVFLFCSSMMCSRYAQRVQKNIDV
ncbi:DUF2069 domain-containing protein [Agaribacterium haliotis]|uniref:DUF2069 domain-containing protein n=1 Tax=Agaribacterium haliotis TaxID=2013869 RepID=UPI000BB5318E|nr:DUF2069 domain-containing protein [Agaribacterium haliotis]